MSCDYPPSRGGWVKCAENPLLGSAEIGTCFDVHVRRWRLWYNGRAGRSEYVGMAVHEGIELE